MRSGTHDVTIVGAGIAGLSLAFALAPRARVTVLEAGEVGGQGASSLPAALLNPHRGRTARAHPDDLAGLAAFWQRDDALRAAGLETGTRRTGVLRIASTARQADDWADVAGAGREVRTLEPTEVPAAYHAPHGAILVEPGGWLRPRLLLSALAEAIRAHGGQILEHVYVDRLTRIDGTYRVHTSSGTHAATQVAFCTGAEPIPNVLAAAGTAGEDAVAGDLPDLQRVAGDVIELASSQPFATPVAGAVYGAWADGKAWIGGNHRAPEALDPGAPEALRRSFSWFVPSLRHAPATAVWTGVRAKQPGNRPLVREIAENVWILGALAGRGFLCGAAEAENLAARMLQDRPGP